MSASIKRILGEQLREAQIKAGLTPSEASADSIWAEEPVPLQEFVEGKRYMNNPGLSPKQFDFVRHFEQVYLPETYPLMVETFGPQWMPVRFVNLLAAEWGKGAGKDHVCRMGLSRVAYLLICLNSPQEYFGMPAQDEIQTLNVAASAPQAHRAFFKPLRKTMVTSKWFADKFEGDPPSELASSIRLKKQIELVSGHSQSETQEGLNLIAAIADEISAFKTGDELLKKGERDSPKAAEQILKVLRTSAATRFPYNFKLAQISYTRFKGDAIEQAVARGNENLEKYGDKSIHYVSGPFATWEVNPRYDHIARVEMTGAKVLVPDVPLFRDDYENDPDMAAATYECLPQLSPNRYFKNAGSVHAALSEVLDQPPVEPEYYWGYDEDDPQATLPSWQCRHVISPSLIPWRGVSYALHADLAISGDRAGIAMCHVSKWDERALPNATEERSEYIPTVKVDFVTAYEAESAAMTPGGEIVAREIQIRWFRQLVSELIGRGFNIELITFDNFQSTDSIQILNAWGIEAKNQSTDRSNIPWQTLRDVMYDGRLQGYHHPFLRDELLALTRLQNGKVDHPNGGSKDEADALACAVVNAIELGGDEGPEPERADDPYSHGAGDPFKIVGGWAGLGSGDMQIESVGGVFGGGRGW